MLCGDVGDLRLGESGGLYAGVGGSIVSPCLCEEEVVALAVDSVGFVVEVDPGSSVDVPVMLLERRQRGLYRVCEGGCAVAIGLPDGSETRYARVLRVHQFSEGGAALGADLG